jgi:4-amino-4-deoxy-L-arabinose transferase-like glycosyltransferase
VIKSLPHILLIAIIITYVVIGALYAIYTPIWQIPDEPAHYNYVRQLVEGQGLPVMEMGDYDQEYLDRLRGERFPPELSIDSVTYEDHQPPLYYLLATPVYVLFGGQAVPLRLLSVVFGAALLAVAFATIRTIFPARPALALVATALIAFIPQHVAMTAGVNNDTLGELILAITLWVLVVYLRGGYERPWPAGLVLAAALLTKGSIYTAVPLVVVGVALRWRLERRTWQWAAGQMAWILIPALLLSAPWFIRNGLTYGFSDVTGQARHGEVVQGQLTTGEFLAERGWGELLSDMALTTFNSFWGQFGWMAVPLRARFYRVLLVFTLAWAAGFAWWLFDRRRPRLTGHRRASLLLLLASSLLSVLVFLGYNVQFLQHQGRYLFPALIPIGTAVALGLDQLAGILPKRMRFWALGSVFAAMALFAVYCLFRVVVPFLS